MEEQNNELLQQVEQLAQQIAHPSGPNFGLIQYDDAAFREELIDALVQELPDFQHIVLQLAPTQVNDLEEVLREKMPPEILESPEIKWIIHVINLEVSLYHEIWTGEPSFMENLNAAASALDGQFPFVSLIYADKYLVERMEKEAESFWQALPFKENFTVADSDQTPVEEEVLALKNQYDEQQASGKKQAMSQILANFGKIIFQAERPDWAIELLDEALSFREASEDPQAVAQALLVKGMCLIRKEQTEDGLELIDDALDIYEAEEAYSELTKGYYLLGQLYHQAAHTDQAVAYFEAAAGAAEQAADLFYLANSHQILGRLQERLGDLDAAADHHAAAAKALEKDDKPLDAAKAWQQHGAVLQDQQKWQPALEAFQQALVLARQQADEFLTSALEDSIHDMEEKLKAKSKKKKGLFGKFR